MAAAWFAAMRMRLRAGVPRGAWSSVASVVEELEEEVEAEAEADARLARVRFARDMVAKRGIDER